MVVPPHPPTGLLGGCREGVGDGGGTLGEAQKLPKHLFSFFVVFFFSGLGFYISVIIKMHFNH
jgi:hypothetical protein